MKEAVVGLFDDFAAAENTVRDLVEHGVPREDISLVVSDAEGKHSRYAEIDEGNNVVVGAGTGAALGGLTGLLIGLGALAIPGIGPVLAAGPLAGAIAGTTVGGMTGVWLGALSEEANVPKGDTLLYAEAVRRGATLVSARVDNPLVARAKDIMHRHHSIDIHQRAAQWPQNDLIDSAG